MRRYRSLIITFVTGLLIACGGDGTSTGNNTNTNNNSNQGGPCGDGQLDPGEECDEGADNDDSAPDACRTDCRDAHCGDGVVDTGETCDDGATNSDTASCLPSCEPNVCGDGFVNQDDDGAGGQIEICDDGNSTDGDDCAGDCGQDFTLCGNNTVDQGEVCDAGQLNSTDPNAPCRPDCHPRFCGDGTIDDLDGEECDDGNTDPGDGCGPTCLFELCGNAFLDPGEICDDGNTVSADGCSGDCQSDETCGNGVTDIAVGETCDDGNTAPGDGCGPSCLVEGCGNGVIDPGELCDDGNTNFGDGCSGDCQSDETCGNGYADTAIGEMCDDGNTVGGDGCSADCASDETCGNGVLDPGEVCDDGDNISGNGCSADCQSDETCGNGIVDGAVGEACDAGAANSNAPNAPCRPSCQLPNCGDGIIDNISLGEQCDDGNVVQWDGCDACSIVEFQVNTYTTSSQWYPAVAIADNGDTLVTWSSFQGVDLTEIMGQRVSGSGVFLGAEFMVNTATTGWQDSVAVAMAGDGRSVVAFSSPDTSSDGVFFQRYDGLGLPSGSETMANATPTSGGDSGAVAMAADGSFVVVWDGTDADSLGVFGQRFTAAGAPSGPEFQVNTYTTSTQLFAAVAMAADGRFVVVWQSNNQDLSAQGVYGQRYTDTGAPDGGEFQINTTTFSAQLNADVAMADDGRFVVVWSSPFQDGDGSGIFAQRFTSAGGPTGPEFQVNTYFTANQVNPALGMTGDGRFVVVWSSSLQDGDDLGIYGQRYDNSGNAVGPEFRCNMFTTGRQDEADVAMGDDGRFVVVWYSSASQDGDNAGVFAQRFDAGGNPRGLLP